MVASKEKDNRRDRPMNALATGSEMDARPARPKVDGASGALWTGPGAFSHSALLRGTATGFPKGGRARWPHQDSNLDLEFRKLLFYPLNYGALQLAAQK